MMLVCMIIWGKIYLNYVSFLLLHKIGNNIDGNHINLRTLSNCLKMYTKRYVSIHNFLFRSRRKSAGIYGNYSRISFFMQILANYINRSQPEKITIRQDYSSTHGSYCVDYFSFDIVIANYNLCEWWVRVRDLKVIQT